jgi:hypothetical protein
MGNTREKPVPVRIPAAMVARLDALRGDLVSREAFVRILLDRALTAEERKHARERHGERNG